MNQRTSDLRNERIIFLPPGSVSLVEEATAAEEFDDDDVLDDE